MRINFEEDEQQDKQQPTNHPRSSVNAPGLADAQKRMEQALVETEKFKAAVENPPGRNSFNLFMNEWMGMTVFVKQWVDLYQIK